MEAIHSHEATRSPKTETSTMKLSDIQFEVSPTGIMGFPESPATGRFVLHSEGMPTLHLNLPDENNSNVELNPRFSSTKHYWDSLEDDLFSGRKEYIIPRCSNPWQGFAVAEGQVRHRALQWDLSMKRSRDEARPPMVPMPGPNVYKMVTFFERLTQQMAFKDAHEPYIVYKRLDPDIRDKVEKMQKLFLSKDSVMALESPVVNRRVSPKLQPMVDWWNQKIQAQMQPPQRPLQRLLKKNSPRVVVMANLMQKKLANRGAVMMGDEEAPWPASYHHNGHMVQTMVDLLEAINYATKTGIDYEPTVPPPSVDHPKHSVKSLPVVF